MQQDEDRHDKARETYRAVVVPSLALSPEGDIKREECRHAVQYHLHEHRDISRGKCDISVVLIELEYDGVEEVHDEYDDLGEEYRPAAA